MVRQNQAIFHTFFFLFIPSTAFLKSISNVKIFHLIRYFYQYLRSNLINAGSLLYKTRSGFPYSFVISVFIYSKSINENILLVIFLSEIGLPFFLLAKSHFLEILYFCPIQIFTIQVCFEKLSCEVYPSRQSSNVYTSYRIGNYINQ